MNDSTPLNNQDAIGKKIVSTYIYAFFTAVTGFIIVVVFSWMLPPDEWGAFSVAKRTGTLVATMALLGVSVAITRYIPMERARQSGDVGHYRLNAVFIIIVSSIIVTGLWLSGLTLIPRLFPLDDVLLLPLFAASLFIVALMWQLLLSSFLRAEGLLRRYNQTVLSGQLLQLIVGILALVIFYGNAFAALLGSATGLSIVVILIAIIIWRTKISVFRHNRLRKDIRRELLSYGYPRMGMGLFEILIISLSLILLGFTGARVEAGLLAIAVQFVAMLKLLFQPITVVMLPEFSSMHGRQDSSELRKKIQVLIKSWLYIISIVIVVLFIILDQLFNIILKEEYLAAVPLTQILLMGMIFYSLYLISVSYLNAVYKRAYSLYFLIVGTCVNIVLYIVLVPEWCEFGAALATCGGMIAVGGLAALFLLKVQPKAFSKINVINYSLCISPLVGVFLLNLLFESLYILLGTGLIGAILCIYLFKNKENELFSILMNNLFKKSI